MFFPFEEHMKGRSDKRPDYKDGFYISTISEVNWYIATPDKKSLDAFVSAVENYILEFDTGADSMSKG